MVKCLYCGEWCEGWWSVVLVWVPEQRITEKQLVLCKSCHVTHIMNKITWCEYQDWVKSRFDSLDGDGTIVDYKLGGNDK